MISTKFAESIYLPDGEFNLHDFSLIPFFMDNGMNKDNEWIKFFVKTSEESENNADFAFNNCDDDGYYPEGIGSPELESRISQSQEEGVLSDLTFFQNFGVCFTDPKTTISINKKWTLEVLQNSDSIDNPPVLSWFQIEISENDYEETAWSNTFNPSSEDPFSFAFRRRYSGQKLSVNKLTSLEFEIQVYRVEIELQNGSKQVMEYANLVPLNQNQDIKGSEEKKILTAQIKLNNMVTLIKYKQQGKTLLEILANTLSALGGFATSVYAIFSKIEQWLV